MSDTPMVDPMADMTAAELEDARVAAAGVMARLLACEAKIAAVEARQKAHADMTAAELEGARVAAAGVMARLLACEASVAAVQARQESHDAEIWRVRRDLDKFRAESAGEF